MRHKILLLLIIILIPLSGGAVFYFLKHQPSKDYPAEEQMQKETIKTKALNKISNDEVISPVLSFDGEKIWYLDASGLMTRVSLNGENHIQPDLPIFKDAKKLIWEKSGSSFIVEQNVDGHFQYAFFDAEQNVFLPYPDQVRKPSFLSNGRQIVYDWVRDDRHHELKISSKTGTNFSKLGDLYRPDYDLVTSPTENVVVLYPLDGESGNLLFVTVLDNPKGEVTAQFRNLDEDKIFDIVKFSPDGRKLLIREKQSVDSFGQWYVYEVDTGKKQGLDLDSGILSVEWQKDNQTIYFSTIREIGKYDLETAKETSVYKFQDSEDLDPIDLIVHPEGKHIFFVDRVTGQLYSLSL